MEGQNEKMARIAHHWEEIQKEILNIPRAETLSGLLKRVGDSSTVEELPVHAELLDLSLREAHLVRPGRFTLLRAYNER